MMETKDAEKTASTVSGQNREGQNTSAEVKTRSVMVVDDSVTMRVMIKDVLKGYKDFVVYEAENGVEALRVMEKHDIRLIFLDYNMPKMNGIEFLKAMRSDPTRKKIAVVMVTTESEEDKVRSGYVSGATVFVTKPFRPEALAKVIDAMRYWHMG